MQPDTQRPRMTNTLWSVRLRDGGRAPLAKGHAEPQLAIHPNRCATDEVNGKPCYIIGTCRQVHRQVVRGGSQCSTTFKALILKTCQDAKSLPHHHVLLVCRHLQTDSGGLGEPPQGDVPGPAYHGQCTYQRPLVLVVFRRQLTPGAKHVALHCHHYCPCFRP